MSTTATLPDLTNIDPRLAALPPGVLQAVQARLSSNQPVSSPPDPSTLSQAAPQVSAPLPPASNAVQMPQSAAPSAIPAPTLPAAAPATQPGPVKSALKGFLYGAGQALVKRAGLETDAEKAHRLQTESIAQQNADTNEGYRQLQGQLINQQTQSASAQLQPMQIPNSPQFGALAGQTLPTSVAVPLLQKVLGYQSAQDIANTKLAGTQYAANQGLAGKQLQYGTGADGQIPFTRRGFANVGGRYITYDKADPLNTRQDMGPSNSLVVGMNTANARAAAQARYRTFDTVDGDGNPVTISGLDALQGGAAHTPYAQAKGIKSDLVGIQQYDQILGRISQNLSVLNDNNQRAVIAHTLSEADKNPGMLQSILTSGLQSKALTPEGAQLTADIMQGREFGGVARKYGGNMNGTEGLMNRIMANQASPLNSQQLNSDLIGNDRAFTAKAMKVVNGITSHNAGNRGGPPNVAPPSGQPQDGATKINSAGDKVVFRGGKWGPA